MTKGQEAKITALERSISKVAFDVGIRSIYLANNEDFDSVNIGAMIASYKQYNSSDLNGFKPLWATDLDFPWQDFANKNMSWMKNEILEAYKERDYFDRYYKKFSYFFFLPATERLKGPFVS
jgi:hypothetical protein